MQPGAFYIYFFFILDFSHERLDEWSGLGGREIRCRRCHRQVGRYLCIAVASALICFVSSQGVMPFYARVMIANSLRVDRMEG
jgi:hypothetical protein